MKAGRESSEHARATRAEGAAFTLLAAGVVCALLGAFQREWVTAAVGVLFVALGSTLLASVVRSYADARGCVKAAAERPRVVRAP